MQICSSFGMRRSRPPDCAGVSSFLHRSQSGKYLPWLNSVNGASMPVYRDDVLGWIKAVASTISQNSVYLTELDSAIGDADHGANMVRGFNAVINKMPEISDKDIGTIFKTVGMTLLSTVGGAGGPLYGTL